MKKKSDVYGRPPPGMDEEDLYPVSAIGKDGKTINLSADQVKKGLIYHDGYSKVNGRGRHVFRAANKFWNDLITEEY